jgi:predicted RND superfamily exporter protein
MGVQLHSDSHEVFVAGRHPTSVFPIAQIGALNSPPVVLAGLVLIALVILIGRLVMKIAWRLVIIAIIAVAVVWVLGILGLQPF